MPIQVLPILKALAPLLAEAGGMVAGLRSSGRAANIEVRTDKLEREMLRAGEVLSGLAQQLQAVAQELRVQAELVEAAQKRARVMLILSVVALAASGAALAVALVR
ncbi:hypothetical protein [Opitutus terrae]|uniref:Uncharacterized protein n=1 Tax=Opitutus terrae (strain DSM 11246 / JCM 15787 / PB90-1) TaxID=452637 RepID=B1ZRB1_OPITP|nr:hypothetical protein [Opitutus terrae]ACB74598.1 hypothetical protein Oter_1313 [Opitutus terrae PB90-1]